MAQFPSSILGIKVELLLNGTWTNITSFVYQRDGINITGRGRPNETTRIQPSSATLTLNNRGGTFSIYNTGGPFYPFLTRNTQLRISVNSTADDGVTTYNGYRFWGEVSQWPIQWDSSGTDVYVPISVAGVLQRYVQSGNIGSPLKRFYTLKTDATAPVALWPMEELSGATQFGNVIVPGDDITWTGTPTLSADSNVAGCDPLPLLSGSVLTGLTGSFSSAGDLLFTVPGAHTWLCPTGITAADIKCIGGAGGGFGQSSSSSGGGGGGGGEYAEEAALAVTAGTSYPLSVGVGGASGTTGSNSTFNTTGVVAHGGTGATGTTGAAGGTGSTNTVHHDGGAGAASSGAGTVVTQTISSGSGSWVAPSGVTTVHVECWGGGGGGAGGGKAGGANSGGYGGGGGAYNQSGSYTVVPGHSYSYSVGSGGASGAANNLGTNGNGTTWDSSRIVAGGGKAATLSGVGAGGTTSGSGGSSGHNGGAGGSATSTGGAGGGGSAGVSGGGGAGGNSSTSTGGTAGAAGSGSGASGGAGGNGNVSGNNGSVPGGGGGGGGGGATAGHGGTGAHGQIKLTYTTNSFAGGGGGGSGGSASAGNAGTTAAGGVAVTGGGPGGNGGVGVGVDGSSPNSGYGGGGGGSGSSNSGGGGNGYSGSVEISWSSATPSYVVTRFVLSVPAAGCTAGASLCRTLIASGGLTYAEVYYGLGGKLGFRGYNGATLKFDSGLLAFNVDGSPMIVSYELHASGANIAWQIQAVTPGATSTTQPTGFSGTYSTATLGAASQVLINAAGTVNDTAIGIVTVQYAYEDMVTSGLAKALNGWIGELAGDRFVRLCLEAGIGGVLIGLSVDTPTLGAQTDITFTDALQQIEDADQGILIEARDMLGLYYRTRASLSNQYTPVMLDYSASVFSPPFSPVPDDAYIRNDVTVTRINGASANSTLTSGSLSNQAPPNGVGDYTYPLNASLQFDAQVAPLANWLRIRGTVDENRFPSLTFDLTRTAMQSHFADVPTMDGGSYFQILNPPPWCPPSPGQPTINQLAFGFSETLNQYAWPITINAVPEAPYASNFLDSALSGSVDNGQFEASAGTWSAVLNCAVAQSSVKARSGSSSLRLTSSASGTMTADHTTTSSTTQNGVPVSPGDYVYASAWFQSAVSSRSVSVGIAWYDSSGALIGTTVFGTAVADNTSTWTQAAVSAIAPATALTGVAVARVASTGGASEVHYVDDVVLIGGWW